ncbi:MAG: hypothetical protein HYV07_26995 [Deltaproteobacteria bacterium]|nr:hypothetical protein [Deltaproteobacteria bacterium]
MLSTVSIKLPQALFTLNQLESLVLDPTEAPSVSLDAADLDAIDPRLEDAYELTSRPPSWLNSAPISGTLFPSGSSLLSSAPGRALTAPLSLSSDSLDLARTSWTLPPSAALDPRQQRRMAELDRAVKAQGMGPGTEAGPVDGPRETSPLGRSLAREAEREAQRRGTSGRCYNAVADAVDRTAGRFLTGGSAYMAADQLARNPRFREVKVTASQLEDLPAGAIVVWGKTAASPDGHISVALGDGREASDHVSPQLTSLRGATNFRVFLPN